jgi:uncharacterized membrane protein YkoI
MTKSKSNIQEEREKQRYVMLNNQRACITIKKPHNMIFENNTGVIFKEIVTRCYNKECKSDHVLYTQDVTKNLLKCKTCNYPMQYMIGGSKLIAAANRKSFGDKVPRLKWMKSLELTKLIEEFEIGTQ